jgi:hypothetical protein
MLTITEEMRESAHNLLKTASDRNLSRANRDLLDAIANGSRKRIDGRWWNEIHRAVAHPKLDKLARLADPARNDNPHERALASAKLAEFKGPPGARPEPPPLPDVWVRQCNPSKSAKAARVNTTAPRLEPVNTTRAEPSKTEPVNTTKPRLANRRNDRHSPGYMAEYMRKWRAGRREKP